MTVEEAILSRMSCRAFTKRPVCAATIREILEVARRAPSGGNLQPWRVHVLGGRALQNLCTEIQAKFAVNPEGQTPEYAIYPADIVEPFRNRRSQCGKDLYAAAGIDRGDRLGQLNQRGRNFDFFGAPLGLFVSIDRRLGPPQWSDVGMFMASIMLLARERGLHTCAQEAWALCSHAVARFLSLPTNLMLFCGMAVGYRDDEAPVNRLRTERAPVDEFATFMGFDASG